MAGQTLWQRVIAAVNREYDRRIRRASRVTEYGASHHAEHHQSAHDDDAAEIVNVPKGTPLGRHPHPTTPDETSPSP
jgi:hypothetical protein